VHDRHQNTRSAKALVQAITMIVESLQIM
jgi:hypothetical protein